MNKILIVGAGIIGGSIIKCLSTNDDYQLYVYDKDPTITLVATQDYNCRQAHDFRAVDDIILCLPIKYIFNCLELIKVQNPDANIYDCSSTKSQIEQHALNLNLNYIGFHPMCGSEKSGFRYASPEMFKDKMIICTKGDMCTSKLVSDLGANIKIMDADTHDRLTAQISHVPQLLSLLVNQVDTEARMIAGNGFKDMTRISGSSYEMWEDILKTNKSNIIYELHVLSENLQLMIGQYENEQYDRLSKWFNN